MRSRLRTCNRPSGLLPNTRSASVDSHSWPTPSPRRHSKLPMRARSWARASLDLLRSSSMRVREARSM